MNRYHPLLVTLHWLLALMIIVGLIMGKSVLHETPNSDPDKLFMLTMHMSMGILILVLMIVRFIVRLKTQKPPHADIGHTTLNKLGSYAHYAFYMVVILMVGSGMALANMTGLIDIVFGGSGDPLPADFHAYPPHVAHGILSTVLIALIVTHVGAFVYHQFIRKDGLFARMWYGKRD